MYKKFLYPIVKCKKLKSWIKYWILSIPEKAKGVWSEILTGSSFTLENSLESVFNKFDLKGNTSQNGTPTPTSPVDIQTVSGNNTIKIQNKNLFDEVYDNISMSLIYRPIQVGEGSFTLSCNIPYLADGACIFLLAGNVTSGASTATNGVYENQSRTQTSVGGYITIAYRALGYNPNNYQVMLEKGSTATDYTAHAEQNLPINLASKNLFDYQAVTNTGIIDDNGTIGTQTTRLFSNKIKVIPSTTYHFKTTAKSSNDEDIVNNRLIYYDSTGAFLRRDYTYSLQSNFSFTVPSDVYYIVIDLRTSALTTTLSNSILEGNTQLEQRKYSNNIRTLLVLRTSKYRNSRRLYI